MRRSAGTVLAATTMTVALSFCFPGAASATSSGAGIPNPPTATGQQRQAGTDYPEAEWYPASTENYSPADRPNDIAIDKIVIHVTQGSWQGSLDWFQNPAAQVSAHYTVRSSDGKIGQSVREADIAWHAGNWDYNETSIGIEHEGYVDDSSWFTEEMYDSSARLTADIATEYGIPIDREHIIGHNEVPGADHTDPGQHWDWDHYMGLVSQYAASKSGSSL